MRPLRVYIDTSVFGGAFDPEFREPTELFFHRAAAGRFHLVVSEQVEAEIAPAPDKVKRRYGDVLTQAELLPITDPVRVLADAYRERGAVGAKSWPDAIHVALATINKCDGLISWNFKHIVQRNKSVLFNAVNADNGYSQLFIASPKEAVAL
jgi:predicted nucleic acid-binding protein